MKQRNLKHLLKIVSGETRLAILRYLKKKRRGTVSEIAKAVHRSVPTASIHLADLEQAGIIERRRRAQSVYYRLSVAQHPIVRTILKEL